MFGPSLGLRTLSVFDKYVSNGGCKENQIPLDAADGNRTSLYPTRKIEGASLSAFHSGFLRSIFVDRGSRNLL